jgi:hypothetical protein
VIFFDLISEYIHFLPIILQSIGLSSRCHLKSKLSEFAERLPGYTFCRGETLRVGDVVLGDCLNLIFISHVRDADDSTFSIDRDLVLSMISEGMEIHVVFT